MKTVIQTEYIVIYSSILISNSVIIFALMSMLSKKIKLGLVTYFVRLSFIFFRPDFFSTNSISAELFSYVITKHEFKDSNTNADARSFG